MPLSGVCPVCGAAFPLEAALTDAEARHALAAALALPSEIGPELVRYLGLHAPATRRVAWPKLTRLIVGLTERISAGTVTRDGVTRAAPLALWQAALTEVLAARDAGTLALPLEGHGYLDQVCWSLAGRAAARASAQAQAERPLHPSHLPAPSAPRQTAQGRTAGLQSLGQSLGQLLKKGE